MAAKNMIPRKTNDRNDNQIVIYKDENNFIQLEVRIDGDMIWLTRQQLATLFDRDYKTISKHINNALKEELADSMVVAKFATTTQHGAIEGKTQTHEIEHFNLEMVTSVGYRVKSSRGVQFRKWANNVLKDYLVKGFAVNERMRHEQLGELRQLVGVLGRTLQSQHLISTDETNALFAVVTDYTYALDTLDNYDYQRLTIDKTTKHESFHATYENAMHEIALLRASSGQSQPELDNHQLHTVATSCATTTMPSPTQKPTPGSQERYCEKTSVNLKINLIIRI